MDDKDIQDKTGEVAVFEDDNIESMDINEVMWEYFDSDALREPAFILRSMDGSDLRWYWEIDDNDEIIWYVSMTSLIGEQLAKDPYLVRWMMNEFDSVGEWKEYLNSRADEGTALHDALQELLISRKVNIDEMERPLREDGKEFSDDDMDKLKHDLMGLAQFIIDHNVKPLAIEIMVRRSDGIAGRVDLICEMDYEEKGYFGEVYKSNGKYGDKGDPKLSKRTRRIKAIVDLKSRDNGNVYESDVIQVNGYIPAVEESIGITPEKAFVLMPNRWRTNPDYNLREVTDDKRKEKLPQLLHNFRIDHPEFRPPSMKSYRGVIDLDEGKVGEVIEADVEQTVLDRYGIKEEETEYMDVQEIREAVSEGEIEIPGDDPNLFNT